MLNTRWGSRRNTPECTILQLYPEFDCKWLVSTNEHYSRTGHQRSHRRPTWREQWTYISQHDKCVLKVGENKYARTSMWREPLISLQIRAPNNVLKIVQTPIGYQVWRDKHPNQRRYRTLEKTTREREYKYWTITKPIVPRFQYVLGIPIHVRRTTGSNLSR